MSAPAPFAILVVDDDADTRENLRDLLEMDGYAVTTAGGVAEALAQAGAAPYLAIILDRRLPDGSAEVALPQLKKLAPGAAVVIVTGYADLEGAIAALREGAADYLLKPVNPDLLRSRLTGLAERRRAADEISRLNKDLRRRVAELETLLEVIPIGIGLALDADCRHIRANPTLARLLRVPPQANASVSAPPDEKPPFKIFRSGKELTSAELPMQTAAARGEEVRDFELDVVHPDGTIVNLIGNAGPLRDEHGQPRGAVGAFLDITERKKAQEQQLQTERLAAIGQMLAVLAHESGNALARSQAALDEISWQREYEAEEQEQLARMQKALDDLRQLYDEVRNYAAPLVLDREDWDLAGVWRQAWANLAAARQEKEATLREETDGVDLHCSIDSFRLDQVFRNIFDNALAAGAAPVHVVVRCRAAFVAGRPAVRVLVSDNGPGMSPEQRRRLFEPFFTTKKKGTGLGMAIARRIIEAHGGRIEADASPEGGAQIQIDLPREQP
jgi:signal transduction histidine kinase